MDIDELFDHTRTLETWRDKIDGEALALCESVEARIEETHQRPHWSKLTERLQDLGVSVSDSAVGQYYRQRYPFLRRK